jgi:hypothetical protein
MLRSISAVMVLALVLGGCGSSSKKSASTGSATGPAATGANGQAVPPVKSKGGSGAKTGTTSAPATPPVAPNGETIKVGHFLAFKTPSGQLGCAYTKDPTTLRCDTRFATRFTHRPPRCEGVYGHSFEVTPHGHASAICAGDSVLSATNAKTLPYGHAWTIGPYACTNQTASLTCTNDQGHGFRLSRGQQLIF